ncbi:MAG TPA: beta-propeller domain-containing protein [Myxococcales bacterium]|jgi:hypothetical protein
MNARSGIAAGLACLAMAGCTGGSNGVPEVESVQQAIVVQAFDDCEGLEQYIEDRAVLSMRTNLLSALENERMLTVGPLFGANAPSSIGDKSQPTEYTGTNLQVLGVDEADFVKTDGTHIFVLANGALYVTRTWPADQMELLAKVPIEFIPREMFLDEAGRAVVFSNHSWSSTTQPVECYPEKPESCQEPGMNVLKVTVVDLADERAPRVVREEYLPGTYLSARRVGNAVRVVTSDSFPWPLGIKMYVDYNAGSGDLGLRAAAYDELIAANEKLIRDQTLEWWLPKGKRRLPDGSEAEVGYSCQDFARPSGATEAGLLTVATLDLDASAPLGRTSLVARAEEVYSTASALYVANSHWWWWPRAGQEAWTYLHKFDLSQPGRAAWVASGAVEGVIVDQFSMDEQDGYLRLATNQLTRVSGGTTFWGRWMFTSRVQVLQQSGTSLTMVGTTGDLAQDERLYSARFIGRRGYLVTYHEVMRMDPLFTIDLSDPANPRKVGQLEVPGYSTYLHPVDEGHLLAVGVTDTRGVKVSLYDVSDFANPKRQAELEIGTFQFGQGGSEAQQEHKAFNYFRSKKLLAIPFFSEGGYENGYTNVSDLRVFKVDVESESAGLLPAGILSMTDLWGYSPYGWYEGWTPGVRRSVMADDFVYAITDSGIRSASIADPATALSTVVFEPRP